MAEVILFLIQHPHARTHPTIQELHYGSEASVPFYFLQQGPAYRREFLQKFPMALFVLSYTAEE